VVPLAKALNVSESLRFSLFQTCTSAFVFNDEFPAPKQFDADGFRTKDFKNILNRLFHGHGDSATVPLAKRTDLVAATSNG
jgi:hypothetical protein